jgi:ATP-dependent DNA helicase DinG
VRKARQAHVVIANHALVMLQAATDTDVRDIATRYVFDEGHHVFDAADSAFAAHLSGRETAELRRWLLGAEGGWGRARGLRRRAEDLIVDERELQAALDDILLAARCLPREGWSERVLERAPSGPTERFLALVHRQVYARAASVDGPYSLETATLPLLEELIPAADSLTTALDALLEPARRFAANLAVWLADPDRAEAFDQAGRMRLDALARSVTRRLIQPTLAWRDMLKTLITADPAPAFVDWFAVERDRGCDVDVGYYRHYIDPTEPFMATIRGAAHGMVITSATLTDQTGEVDTDWRAAETRTGALHLSHPAIRAHVLSPFDYGAQTKVLIVTDIPRDNMDQLAAAMGALFRASGGGGLGLFTAIGRLRAVHERLARPLEECGIPLLAQHVDGLDVATLIEIFRAEETACLLGTDAVRDGVDVPGRALRLICFDRVPWPRPDILHKARRTAFGGKEHDDRLVRLRLRQAFGRLVRRADDHGMFVMLDSRLPSRLLSAFPAGMVAERVPLGEAIGLIRQFCATA